MKHSFPPSVKLYFLSFLLLFCFNCGWAVSVRSRIIDQQGKPLADVSVTDGEKRTRTDAEGHFSLQTERDSLLVFKLGYSQQVIYVKKVPNPIIMSGKEITLQPIRVTEHYLGQEAAALDKTVLKTEEVPTAAPASVLLKESALHTSDVMLTGESVTLSLLGNLNRHTLIMLDNVPLNPQGEAVDLSTLPFQNIKRMEIVKGNASLHGGSSAIGGIIYLYTDKIKTAHPLGLGSSFSAGSFGAFSQDYSFEQMSPLFSYRVTLSKVSAENDFPYKPRPWWNMEGSLIRKNNRKEQSDISLQLDSSAGDLGWHYKLSSSQIYKQLPGPVNFLDIYTHAYLTGNNLRQSFSTDYSKKALSNLLTAWLLNDDTEYNNTKAVNPVYLKHYQQGQISQGVKDQFEYKFMPFTAILEAELSSQSYHLDDLLMPSLSIPDKRRNLQAGAIKLKTKQERSFLTHNLQAGIRFDDVTHFGTYTSWRVEDAFTWEGELQVEAGGAYGTGFSLPSLYDLYWKGDAQALGNPDLQPETSEGGNAFLSASYNRYTVKAAYYFSEIKNLIQWRQTYLFGTQWKPLNVGKAKITNWEISAQAQPLNWFAFNASATFTHAKDETLDANLTYTPEMRAVTNCSFLWEGLKLDFGIDHSGRQWSTPDNLIKPLPAMTLWNSSLQYSRNWNKLKTRLSVSLNNLFDKQYEIYAYVPQPGFNWSGSLSLEYTM